MHRGTPRSTNQIEYQPTRPSHRRLIVGAIIIIVLAGAFLFFWQTVLQFAFAPAPEEWSLAFCGQLLARHSSELADIEFVTRPGPDRTFSSTGNIYTETQAVTFRIDGVEDVVLSCEVEIVAAGSQLQDVGDAYDCQGVIVKYNSEETETWLLTGVQLENTVPGNPTPFTDLITYYNPAVGQAFESRLAALQAHSCEI